MLHLSIQRSLLLLLAISIIRIDSAQAAFSWPISWPWERNAQCESPLHDFSHGDEHSASLEFKSFEENLESTKFLAHLVTLSLKQIYPKDTDFTFTISKVDFFSHEARARLVKQIIMNLLRSLPVKWDIDNLSEQKLLQKHFTSKKVKMDRVISQWKNIHDQNQLRNFVAHLEAHLDGIFKSNGSDSSARRKQLLGFNSKFDRELGERGYVVGAIPIQRNANINARELDHYLRRYATLATSTMVFEGYGGLITEEAWDYFSIPNQLTVFPSDMAEYIAQHIRARTARLEKLANERAVNELKGFTEFYERLVKFDEANLETVREGLNAALQERKDSKIADIIFRVADLYLLREVLDIHSQREIFIQIISVLVHLKKSTAQELFAAIMQRCQSKAFTSYDDFHMQKAIRETSRVLGAEKSMLNSYEKYKWQVKPNVQGENPDWFKMSAAEATDYLDGLRSRNTALKAAPKGTNADASNEKRALPGFGSALGLSPES